MHGWGWVAPTVWAFVVLIGILLILKLLARLFVFARHDQKVIVTFLGKAKVKGSGVRFRWPVFGRAYIIDMRSIAVTTKATAYLLGDLTAELEIKLLLSVADPLAWEFASQDRDGSLRDLVRSAVASFTSMEAHKAAKAEDLFDLEGLVQELEKALMVFANENGFKVEDIFLLGVTPDPKVKRKLAAEADAEAAEVQARSDLQLAKLAAETTAEQSKGRGAQIKAFANELGVSAVEAARVMRDVALMERAATVTVYVDSRPSSLEEEL